MIILKQFLNNCKLTPNTKKILEQHLNHLNHEN